MNRFAVGKRRALTLVGAVALGLTAACQTDVAPVAVSNVSFSILNDSLLNGRTYQTIVTVKDVNGVELTGRKVTYESLFPAIATVSSTGLVTAVAPGGAAIKASVDGRSATTNIKVLDKVTSVVIAPRTDNVAIGQSKALIVTVAGANGASIGGRNIRWQSSSPSIATVNNQGVVSGVSKGTVTIMADAELDQVNGTATITVIDVPVATIALAPAGTQIMRLGAFLQATPTLRDANNNILTGRTVNWQSSNPAVATVTSTGLVTAVGLGSVSITAESEGRSASMPVQVTEVPPKSVTLSPDTVALLSANVRQLVPVVVDSLNRVVNSLATRSVLWTSSNPAVASVSTAGVVTGITGGTTRVNVSVDNVRSNDVVVNVTDQVTLVRLTPATTPPMRVGNTLPVTAQALNSQNQVLPGKVFNWTSSNPSVATVSNAGLVTAVTAGNVTITAETEGRSATLQIAVTLVPIGTVTLVPSSDTLITGDLKQYNPVVTDSAGRPVTALIGRSVIWNSTNIPVASVSSQGIVQASNSQTGTALISVTVDGVASNNMSVRVAAVASISVSPTSVSVQVGNTQAIVATARDASGNVISTTRNFTYTLAFGGGATATVSPAGVVTGVAAGTTSVTVTLSGVVGVSTIVNVTVTP